MSLGLPVCACVHAEAGQFSLTLCVMRNLSTHHSSFCQDSYSGTHCHSQLICFICMHTQMKTHKSTHMLSCEVSRPTFTALVLNYVSLHPAELIWFPPLRLSDSHRFNCRRAVSRFLCDSAENRFQCCF